MNRNNETVSVVIKGKVMLNGVDASVDTSSAIRIGCTNGVDCGVYKISSWSNWFKKGWQRVQF